MIVRNLKIIISLALALSFLIYASCSSNDEPKPVDCSLSDLSITLGSKVDPTSCSTNNGTITASASGGATPYQFKLNSGSYGSGSTFTDLSSGTYSVFVKDNNGCEKELSGITLSSPAAPVAGTPVIANQTDCSNPNGSITANVSGGTPPYQYKLGDGAFGTTATFTGLKAGNYTITIKDGVNCNLTVNSTVVSATGISYATDIAPILQTNCIKSGCHNGDNGTQRNWSVFANVQNNAIAIKTRTGNRSMPQDIAPAGLPQAQIDMIACWVDEGAKNN